MNSVEIKNTYGLGTATVMSYSNKGFIFVVEKEGEPDIRVQVLNWNPKENAIIVSCEKETVINQREE